MKGKTIGLATAGACVAACAGVSLFPGLLAGLAVGEAGHLMGGEAAVLLAAAAALLAFWLGRRSRARACSCGPGQGCNAGESCDLPPN